MSTSTATRLGFFVDCVEREAADAKGGRVYYFKLDEPPQEISALYSLSTDPELWEPWWEEYLTSKYAAMTAFNRDPGCSTDQLIKLLEIDEDYAEVVDRWRQQAPREALVYRLRVEQIGDEETVRGAWYDDIPGFDRWMASCNVIDTNGSGNGEAAWVAREALLAEVVDKVLFSTEPDTRARDGIAVLHEARQAIVEQLGEEGVEHLYAVGSGRVSPVDDVAAEIATVTLNLIAQRQRDLKQHADAVMTIIKSSFNASVVDFLLLRRRKNVEQLEFLETTAVVTDIERAELEREASYSRPAGITGAILVAQHDHEMFHVGTNLLEEDPRQSPVHRSAYERLYGRVQNFWVFPLHVGDELLGALRVVNRLDEKGNVVPWPFLQRHRLVGLCKFIGALWRAYGVEIPVDGSEAPPQHLGEAVNEAAERCLAIAEALTHDAGVGTSGETLASVLAALAAQSEIRIEDDRLRETVLMVSPEHLDSRIDQLSGTRFESLSRVPPLSELDQASSGDGNVLVVRTDGRIIGRVRSLDGSQLDVQQLARQISAEFSLHISNEFPRLVEVWRQGDHLADYAFVMRGGVWKLRAFSAATELAMASDFNIDLLEDLLRKATRISYRHGAILVVWSKRLPRTFTKQRLRRHLGKLSDAEFDEYAGKDGGCIVTPAGMLENIQVMFPTQPPKLSDPQVAEQFRLTQRRLRESLRGTRHEGALSASVHLPGALVLCASENRTVCAFVNGASVLWDH